VDITADYVEDARRRLLKSNSAQSSSGGRASGVVRKEFDVVLNLADGAIGNLEDWGDNLSLFDVIAPELKAGGKYLMEGCSCIRVTCCGEGKRCSRGAVPASDDQLTLLAYSQKGSCPGLKPPAEGTEPFEMLRRVLLRITVEQQPRRGFALLA
jgi:hypothetical protein